MIGERIGDRVGLATSDVGTTGVLIQRLNAVIATAMNNCLHYF